MPTAHLLSKTVGSPNMYLPKLGMDLYESGWAAIGSNDLKPHDFMNSTVWVYLYTLSEVIADRLTLYDFGIYLATLIVNVVQS